MCVIVRYIAITKRFSLYVLYVLIKCNINDEPVPKIVTNNKSATSNINNYSLETVTSIDDIIEIII